MTPDRPISHRRHPALLALTAALTLAACSASDAPRASSTSSDGDGQVLATIGDSTITMADLPDVARAQLAEADFRYRTDRFRVLEQALQDVIREHALAQEADSRGVTVQEFLADATDGRLDVGYDEVERWYMLNRSRLGGRTLEQIAPQIQQLLTDNKLTAIVDSIVADLGDRDGITIHLEPVRAEFTDVDAPSIGPDDAPITIVEFSDFQCPYCRVFLETLRAVRREYGDDVRLVYRQFPLSNHAEAFKAAEASLCAHDQGRFWEMHDLMFAEQRALDVPALKEKARRIKLDGEQFDECLDSGKYATRVQEDLREGSRFGVQGTPGSFVNGIPVTGGAVPVETLSDLIDQELRRQQK